MDRIKKRRRCRNRTSTGLGKNAKDFEYIDNFFTKKNGKLEVRGKAH
jgi:hypothetical protein